MQNSDLRQQTFSTSSWPYSKRARKYKGLPRALSQAGFYFAPTSTVKDRCLCYLCGKSISGLADGEEEDLLALHSAANSSCPLVVIGEQVAGTAFGGTIADIFIFRGNLLEQKPSERTYAYLC